MPDRTAITTTMLLALLVGARDLTGQAAPIPDDFVARTFEPWDRPDSPGCAVAIARDPTNPSLDEMLETVVARTWHAPTPADAGDAALAGVVRRAVLDRLLALAGDERATPAVRAAAIGQLHALADRIDPATASTPAERGLQLQARRDIRRFLEGP